MPLALQQNRKPPAGRYCVDTDVREPAAKRTAIKAHPSPQSLVALGRKISSQTKVGATQSHLDVPAAALRPRAVADAQFVSQAWMFRTGCGFRREKEIKA